MFMKYIIIFSLVLESCSFRFPIGDRAPASAANFTEYKTKMASFRARALGSERDSNCTKEQIDEDFNRLMASLKKDSCRENNFTINKEEFAQKNCPKIKVEGLFDRIVKKTISEEKAREG